MTTPMICSMESCAKPKRKGCDLVHGEKCKCQNAFCVRKVFESKSLDIEHFFRFDFDLSLHFVIGKGEFEKPFWGSLSHSAAGWPMFFLVRLP